MNTEHTLLSPHHFTVFPPHTISYSNNAPFHILTTHHSQCSHRLLALVLTAQMAMQLGYLYNQIISVLTQAQLLRIFADRKNFDLRRLLTGL